MLLVLLVGYQRSNGKYIFSLLLHLLDANHPVGSRLCDRPYTSDIGPSFWHEDSHQVCEFISPESSYLGKW